MLLSIIIPVYNVERYVSQCLESILCQIKNRDDVEIIIVDDGSIDNSPQIVKRYLNNTNVRLFSQKNSGLSVTRNNGLKYANGLYVWFVDSDDWILENAINTIIKIIHNDNSLDIIATKLECHIEGTDISYCDFSSHNNPATGRDYLLSGYPQGASQRFIMRKEFLINNNLTFYPGLLHEDGLFGYKMLYLARTLIVLRNPVYAYRIRKTGSIMSSVSLKNSRDLLFIHRELKKFLINNVSKEDSVWYCERIYSIIYRFFDFSYPIINTKEFKQLYLENKHYIKKESLVLFKSPKNWVKALIMCIFPLKFYRIKSKIKCFLSYIKG